MCPRWVLAKDGSWRWVLAKDGSWVGSWPKNQATYNFVTTLYVYNINETRSANRKTNAKPFVSCNDKTRDRVIDSMLFKTPLSGVHF